MYAIYARQSVEKEDSTSIEAQIEFCINEIKLQTKTLEDIDKSIYKVYDDRGFSGKDMRRPNLELMMEDINKGAINTVVVYKVDRISRSVLDFSNIWEKFNSHGVKFISCNEKFDTNTPSGEAMLRITMVFAELERKNIQKRVADVYLSRSRQGYYMGGRVPYGFKLEETQINGNKTHKYAVNPEEAAHIKLLYDMYADSATSLGDIVRYLRDNKIEHLRGSLWSTSRISEFLRNPCYVKADIDVYNFYKSQGVNIINDVSDYMGINGCYLYNLAGDSPNRKQFELVGRDLVIAPHEGIISSDVWLKCRIRCMNNRQSTMTCKGSNTWLVGKLKCRKCGYALTIRKSKSQAGRYFICSSIGTSKSCGGAGTLYATEIEDWLLGEIKAKLNEFTDLTKDDTTKVNPKVNQLKIKIAQIEKDIDTWFNQAKEASKALLERINKEISRLDNERAELEKEMFLLSYDTPISDIDKIKDFVDKWDSTEFEDKKRVVDAVIKVAYIGNGEAEIIWKL